MNARFHDVSDAELAVLHELWARQQATIRQLTDVLYPGGTNSHYATVQKLLERLEGKGFVQRDRSGSVHQFQATVDRETLLERRLRSVAESLFDGSFTPLLTHLVRRQLSGGERAQLRELIDQLDRESSSPE
ncbi:MAG: BlaI/MecI/CopY family transcriptional regulator [Pirellulaceae bacterium]